MGLLFGLTFWLKSSPLDPDVGVLSSPMPNLLLRIRELESAQREAAERIHALESVQLATELQSTSTVSNQQQATERGIVQVLSKKASKLTWMELAKLEWRFVGNKSGTHQVKCGSKVCIGGDRMHGHHNYGQCYADVLNKLLPRAESSQTAFRVGEIGILMGTGLAVWDAVIPNVEIDGWDIDITNTANNLPNMRARGAFPGRGPRLNVIDSHKPVHENIKEVERVLGNAKYDLFIDDGWHSPEGITATVETFERFMHDEGVYVVEDLGRCPKQKGAKDYTDKHVCADANFKLLCPPANSHGFYVECCPHDVRLCALTRGHSASLGWIEQSASHCRVPA